MLSGVFLNVAIEQPVSRYPYGSIEGAITGTIRSINASNAVLILQPFAPFRSGPSKSPRCNSITGHTVNFPENEFSSLRRLSEPLGHKTKGTNKTGTPKECTAQVIAFSH